ncbi:aldo/keto reductase [Vreelandella titanicae]|uniref:aldo/keto reductase n=1 Tax=Vreelandella titanicae TaxID=664683 RepID=UPI003CFFE5F9|tara:strand:- start:195 stop:980 length:786 start_codon:yes stop_codon:yes gene_type:complete
MNLFEVIGIGGKHVPRLGFGTMQLTGVGYWGGISKGEIKNAINVLRTAYELGVRHFDTADSYGPFLAEELLRDALYPYSDELLIATKGGFTRQGPGVWQPVGRPEYLHQCVEMSLRRLRLEQIPLYYLHRIDPGVPFEDQIGVLDMLKSQGKIGHIGLSKVSAEDIEKALEITQISAIQNKFNPTNADDSVIRFCEVKNIPYVAYSPFSGGRIFENNRHRKTKDIAVDTISWILKKSPTISVIPSTTSASHLKEICNSRNV